MTFGELSGVLQTLGFAESKQGGFWLLEHPPSDTWFRYRTDRRNERVTVLDLQMTRRHLDLRGVLYEQAFDDVLRRATA